MTEQPHPDAPATGPSSGEQDPRVVIIGPNGMAVSGGTPQEGPGSEDSDDEERHITELVEQPAKVMRIGSMIRQLLDEVKAAPLDEKSRARLAGIYDSSVDELKSGLAPELVEELERLSSPFTAETPTEPELRIAQAQLVGWLEGLFHGIQTAIYAQQMAARAQLEQMRRALPPGAMQAMEQQAQAAPDGPEGGRSSGLYL